MAFNASLFEFCRHVFQFICILFSLLYTCLNQWRLKVKDLWAQSEHGSSAAKKCSCTCNAPRFEPRGGLLPFPGESASDAGSALYCPQHRPRIDDLTIDSVFNDGLTNDLQNGSRDADDSKIANSMGKWPSYDAKMLEKFKEPPAFTSANSLQFGAFVENGTKELGPLTMKYKTDIGDFNKPLEYDDKGNQVFKTRSFDVVKTAKKEMGDIEKRLKKIMKESAMTAVTVK